MDKQTNTVPQYKHRLVEIERDMDRARKEGSGLAWLYEDAYSAHRAYLMREVEKIKLESDHGASSMILQQKEESK